LNAPAALSTAPALGAWLRSATRLDHAQVDAAFGHHDLATRAGYTAFLTAHARVLPAIEARLRPAELIPGWQGRAGALARDLATLGTALPAPAPLALPPGEAARWGALYVLEGSRLGGAVLAKSVPPDLPRAFLAATHAPGQWRALLARLDTLDLDRDETLAGARAAFTAFVNAATVPA
jgi:heme oxygenase